MEISQIKAVPNSVILERIEEDEVLASGIILLCNQNSRDPIAKGKILSVGKCTSANGSEYEPEFKAGDTVLYRRNAYVINIAHDTKKYFSVPINRVEVVLESV